MCKAHFCEPPLLRIFLRGKIAAPEEQYSREVQWQSKYLYKNKQFAFSSVFLLRNSDE